MNIYNSKLKNFAALFFSSFLMLFVFTGFSSAQSAKSAIAGQARAAGISANIPKAAKPAKQPEREWLVMVYMSAKNDLGAANLAFDSVNAMERIGPSEKVAAVVEYGAFEGKDGITEINTYSRTLDIRRDNDIKKITSPVMYTTEEADMANPNILVNFVYRAVHKYPAKKYMLVIWNHGGGLKGISSDVMNDSIMSVKDLGEALKQINAITKKKLDIFAMDACLMQSASIAYQFRNYADRIIASQFTEPGKGFPYDWLMYYFNKEYAGDDDKAVKEIIDSYSKYNTDKDSYNLTLSAVRTSAMQGFVNLLDKWVKEVRNDRNAFKIATDIGTVKNSAASDTYEADYKDLVSYLELINSGLKESSAKKAGTELISYIKNCLVIYNYSRSEDTNGISVFMPNNDYLKSEYWDLDFSAASDWPGFLVEMVKQW